MDSLIEHLESRLGMIQAGWCCDAEGSKLPFQIICCKGGLLPDTVSYSTLGFSNNSLPSCMSDKLIRQELVIATDISFDGGIIPGLLQQVALEALDKGRPYLRGEVIGPRGNLFEGKPFEAFYVTIPSWFDDAFQTFVSPGGLHIIFALLIPITGAEAKFIRSQGWIQFEDLLEKAGIDPIDLDRSGIV